MPATTVTPFAWRAPPVVDRFSDDGEPSGTAGKPILTVLEHKVYNAIVVVTRYFGGTKLGTGGLVKAYTQATQALLEAAGAD
jgi:putative IMPACT (imprinted ancient) family translation regulator